MFYIALVTGNSTDGPGGAMEIVAGSSTEAKTYSRSYLDFEDGPDVQLKAGNATSSKSTGGNVSL